MVSCKDFLGELSNYLDDDVTSEHREALRAHLSGCRTCQVLLDSSRKTLRIMTETQSFDLPDRLSERMVQGVLERLRANPPAGDPDAPER